MGKIFTPNISEAMQRSSLFTIAVLLFLTIQMCGSAIAQEKVLVETVAGKSVNGLLERVADDGALVGDGLEGINIQEVLSISTGKEISTPPEANTQITLVDGGKLHASETTFEGESIRFPATAAGIDSISMQTVRSVAFKNSSLIQKALSRPSTDEDTVLVDRGESMASVSGVLESWSAEKLQLNFKGKSRPIGREKVAAIVVADLGLDRPEGSIATASLADGSKICGVLRSLDENSVTMELTGQRAVRFLRSQLARLAIESDSIAWLSTLDPVEVQQQPKFTVTRQWRRNQSVEGNPIRLLVSPDNGEQPQLETFENGIGTSSFSRLVFENTREFTKFVAIAGIDAETSGRGDCEMRVEGDGITLWARRIKGSDVAVEIDVDISGISQVALVVEYGEQFDLADHADWARARFLRTE